MSANPSSPPSPATDLTRYETARGKPSTRSAVWRRRTSIGLPPSQSAPNFPRACRKSRDPYGRRGSEGRRLRSEELGQFMHYFTSPPRPFLENARGHSREHRSAQAAKEKAMLYTIAAMLLILWLLGFVSGYTIGAFIHVLLVIALVLLLVQFVSGRRVV